MAATIEELPLFFERQICSIGSFIYAQEDSWLRTNHHLYFTDGSVGGTSAKAIVAHGFGPAEIHMKKAGNRTAICSSAATKQLVSIYYEAGHVQPAKCGQTLPVFCNLWAGSMTRFNTARSKDGIVPYTRASVGLLAGALAEGEKDGAMCILQDVIDLDAAQRAITSVRECGLLGHGNAHSFRDCKEVWLDEAGNDLDVMRQTLVGKPEVEAWLSFLKTYLQILHPSSSLLASELWAGVEESGLQWEQSIRDFQRARRSRMDAQTQEIYNSLGSHDEPTLRHFATAINGLAWQDPANRGAIVNWAKRV